MTPAISSNRFSIYILHYVCNSETFVCEKCQCVHYDSVLALLVQMLDGPSTANATFVTRLHSAEMDVNYFARIFAAGVSQEFFSFVFLENSLGAAKNFREARPPCHQFAICLLNNIANPAQMP